jgi:cellulose biosynthesis protein BcsQ
MRILTIASQKGGAGKTTLAAHLAVEAERTGAGRVAVVDTDPQGSLAAWWNTREAPTPLFTSVEIARLPDHLRTLARRQASFAVEAVRALAQHGQVAPVTVHQRIDFAASMVDGRTVGEPNPGSRSADEVTSLWQYVLTLLRKNGKKA